jgi:hypothetical protein
MKKIVYFMKWFSELFFLFTRICLPAFRQSLWGLGWYFLTHLPSMASDSLALKRQNVELEKLNPFTYTMQ